jgi:rubrerythrin
MSPREVESRRLLIALLRAAYSGERAASLAYRGHARAVSDADERARIRSIDEEELHHRRQVGALLSELGARPSRLLELRAALIGNSLAALCRVSGWFVPMYGAGRLERGNIVEYENAARLARDAALPEFVESLLAMAEVEWEHERYFRAKAASHALVRIVRLWPEPPPKETIRASFARETCALARASDDAAPREFDPFTSAARRR